MTNMAFPKSRGEVEVLMLQGRRVTVVRGEFMDLVVMACGQQAVVQKDDAQAVEEAALQLIRSAQAS